MCPENAEAGLGSPWNHSGTRPREHVPTFLCEIGFLLTSEARTVLPGMPDGWAGSLSFVQPSNLVPFCYKLLDTDTNRPCAIPNHIHVRSVITVS